MIELTKDGAARFHGAVAREGLVLSLCGGDGNVLGHLSRADGDRKWDRQAGDPGDLSQLHTGAAWIVSAHTELGALFLQMWRTGEVGGP